MKETVLQFGEGNFLRAFADMFIDSMNKSSLYDGRAVIVKPTSRGSFDAFTAQGCRYTLVTRGTGVYERETVECVSRIVSPYTDYEGFLALALIPELRFVISNTTEAGIVFDPACRFDDAPPDSFPGKVAVFLYRRWKAGLPGLVFLPCELIDDNGRELKNFVLKYAHLWGLPDEFSGWINLENEFCDTLVDRIVTGYSADEAAKLKAQTGFDDRLLDTCEPYHLWVIEGDHEDELPLKKAGFNVIWTDDVKPYKKRKVRVLNGAHTSLVFPAMLAGLATVDECLSDPLLERYLKSCLYGEILEALGKTDDNIAFAGDVLTRFSNPFLSHRLRAISLNSVSKFTARVLPSIIDYETISGAPPRLLVFALAALIRYYKTETPDDSERAVSMIKDCCTAEILGNAELWGCDLTRLLPEVENDLNVIAARGIREALEWILR